MKGTLLRWSGDQRELGAALVVFAAFVARLWTAHGTFLNPDEALHFQIANHASWPEAYRASLTTAHPPLLIFVIHFWKAFGASELFLRLPSVVAGTVFCWLLFRWVHFRFSRAAAWIALVFAAFLPPVVALSSEVRQYALLLAFMAAALWFLETAFATESVERMLLAYLFVLLALLTHYSAFLFAAALGAYSFLRWMERKHPARVKAAWAAGQIVILVTADFLYRTQLSALHSGASITTQPWLYNSLFHRGQQHLLLFIFARTFGVFQFVFGQLAVGDVACILFVIGVVYLVRQTQQPVQTTSHDIVHGSAFLALLVAPFVLACGTAIADVYPYGGTRHSAFLIPSAIAGVSFGIVSLFKQDRTRALIAALLIVVVCLAFGKPHRPYMTREDQSIANMSRAMTYLKQNVAPESLILVDYQSSLLLSHYLCGAQPVIFDHSPSGFLAFRCGAYRILSTSPETSIFTAESFLHGNTWNALPKFIGTGDRFWVIQAGWDIDLARQLRTTSPRLAHLQSESFGANIQIFPMRLEPEGPVVP